MVEGTRDSGEVEMETRRPRWVGEERRVEKAVMRSEEAGGKSGLAIEVRSSVRWSEVT